jgi:pyruvate,orthophosphate dikinase
LWPLWKKSRKTSARYDINAIYKTRPDIILGICGEPNSVKFCNRLKLTYVSCSPNRVPVAKLAAAQAVLEQK